MPRGTRSKTAKLAEQAAVNPVNQNGDHDMQKLNVAMARRVPSTPKKCKGDKGAEPVSAKKAPPKILHDSAQQRTQGKVSARFTEDDNFVQFEVDHQDEEFLSEGEIEPTQAVNNTSLDDSELDEELDSQQSQATSYCNNNAVVQRYDGSSGDDNDPDREVVISDKTRRHLDRDHRRLERHEHRKSIEA